MKKSYECEVATHIGPESCGAAREGIDEALTGGEQPTRLRIWSGESPDAVNCLYRAASISGACGGSPSGKPLAALLSLA